MKHNHNYIVIYICIYIYVWLDKIGYNNYTYNYMCKKQGPPNWWVIWAHAQISSYWIKSRSVPWYSQRTGWYIDGSIGFGLSNHNFVRCHSKILPSHYCDWQLFFHQLGHGHSTLHPSSGLAICKQSKRQLTFQDGVWQSLIIHLGSLE